MLLFSLLGCPCDDCDDDSHTEDSHSGTEVCNAIDDDGDGLVDDADDSLDAASATAWYPDADQDGYGAVDGAVTACIGPDSYVTDSTDCNDQDPTVAPSADERCNDVDDDCDALVDALDDDLIDASAWYPDQDGDGYGPSTDARVECDQPAGHVLESGDCDDFDAAISPAAPEICNDLDDDCDTLIDGSDPDVTGTTTWHEDADRDGYGSAGSYLEACNRPAGFIEDATDCDDADPAVNPAAAEIPDNAIDDNCDEFETWPHAVWTGSAPLSCVQGTPGPGNGDSDITMAVWVLLEPGQNGGYVLDADPDDVLGERGFALYVSAENPGWAGWTSGASRTSVTYSVRDIDDGHWHLITMEVREGIAVYFALDGVSSEPSELLSSYWTATSHPAIIGAKEDAYGAVSSRFDGSIAELGVWAASVSPSATPGVALDAGASSALAVWQADSTGFIDASGHGNACTVMP